MRARFVPVALAVLLPPALAPRKLMCNLSPGEYRLTVHSDRASTAPSFFAAASFTIVERDLRNLTSRDGG